MSIQRRWNTDRAHINQWLGQGPLRHHLLESLQYSLPVNDGMRLDPTVQDGPRHAPHHASTTPFRIRNIHYFPNVQQRKINNNIHATVPDPQHNIMEIRSTQTTYQSRNGSIEPIPPHVLHQEIWQWYGAPCYRWPFRSSLRTCCGSVDNGMETLPPGEIDWRLDH